MINHLLHKLSVKNADHISSDPKLCSYWFFVSISCYKPRDSSFSVRNEKEMQSILSLEGWNQQMVDFFAHLTLTITLSLDQSFNWWLFEALVRLTSEENTFKNASLKLCYFNRILTLSRQSAEDGADTLQSFLIGERLSVLFSDPWMDPFHQFEVVWFEWHHHASGRCRTLSRSASLTVEA